MLTTLDEYPYHQITDTFNTVAHTNQAWNDGHYICLCDMDGNVSLVSTLRLYQNNDVMDGFVCIRHSGRQWNYRVSRRLRPAIDDLRVGPLRVELVEPLKQIRLVLEDNNFGISCDVLCETSGVPWMGPVSITKVDGRLMAERLTYEISGVVSGHVTVDGTRFPLTKDRDSFFRNHSWGFMGGRGGPRKHGAPPVGRPMSRAGIRNWILYNMPDHGGFVEFAEDDKGNQRSSAYTLPDGGSYPVSAAILLPDRMVRGTGKIEHNLTFYGSTDRLKGGSFGFTDEEGRKRTYEIEDLGWVYCQGGGYFGGFNDGLGQGVWRGEFHEEGEVWDVSDPIRIIGPKGDELKYDANWAENFTRLKSEGRTGLAHYESVVFGNYPRYGFNR